MEINGKLDPTVPRTPEPITKKFDLAWVVPGTLTPLQNFITIRKVVFAPPPALPRGGLLRVQ